VEYPESSAGVALVGELRPAVRKCGKSFERIETVKDHDPAKVRCPKCKSKKVERRWSSVFAVTSKKS
jgi:putative FmdB family regulatory protein